MYISQDFNYSPVTNARNKIPCQSQEPESLQKEKKTAAGKLVGLMLQLLLTGLNTTESEPESMSNFPPAHFPPGVLTIATVRVRDSK